MPIQRTPPGRCTSWPAANRARRYPLHCCVPPPSRGGHPRMAVRRELPGGGRPGRNHCPPAACARRGGRAGPGRLDRTTPAAAARPGRRLAGRRAGRLVARARHAGALPADQAHRRRLSCRREQAAGAACAGRGLRRRCQDGGTAADGLHRCQGDAERSRLHRVALGTGCGGCRPAVSVLPGACAAQRRRAARGAAGRAVVMAGGMEEVLRHPCASGASPWPDLDLVAWRGADHGSLSRSRGAGAGPAHGSVLDGEILGPGRTAHPHPSSDCNNASAART